ncbi:surface protease GP63, partial [Angomonas deanei]
MEVEDSDGSSEGKRAHWKARTAKDDIMASYLSTVMFLSPMTLAYMEDTGHYTPNYERAETLPFGHQAGCDFVEKPCITDGKTDFPDVFATTSGEMKCTSDYAGIGQAQSRNNGCPNAAFKYFGDNYCTSNAPLDYCPIYDMITRCVTTDGDWSTRCFNGQVDGAACLPVKCDFDQKTYTVGGITCNPGETTEQPSGVFMCLKFSEACPYKLSHDQRASCDIKNCDACFSGMCEQWSEGCEPSEDGKSCTKKGLRWWGWLLIALACAVVVAAVILLVFCCCCRGGAKADTTEGGAAEEGTSGIYAAKSTPSGFTDNSSSVSFTSQMDSSDSDFSGISSEGGTTFRSGQTGATGAFSREDTRGRSALTGDSMARGDSRRGSFRSGQTDATGAFSRGDTTGRSALTGDSMARGDSRRGSF